MVAIVISAGMTSFAGVIYAFYYNNLFPEQVFHISSSIEIILAPFVGGVGTLFGPVLGAFVLTGLAETLTGALNGFVGLVAEPEQGGDGRARVTCAHHCIRLPALHEIEGAAY